LRHESSAHTQRNQDRKNDFTRQRHEKPIAIDRIQLSEYDSNYECDRQKIYDRAYCHR
jgi:hypothetical protein